MLESRLPVVNEGGSLLQVFVEPWANDFWLEPGEELVVIATNENATPEFERVDERDGLVSVYVNTPGSLFYVMQGDVELECGHRRPRERGWLRSILTRLGLMAP